MARINVTIPDELERSFRIKVTDKFGGRHGDMSKAFTEAISEWVNKDQKDSILASGPSSQVPHIPI